MPLTIISICYCNLIIFLRHIFIRVCLCSYYNFLLHSDDLNQMCSDTPDLHNFKVRDFRLARFKQESKRINNIFETRAEFLLAGTKVL
jgi:hypothetical protein